MTRQAIFYWVFNALSNFEVSEYHTFVISFHKKYTVTYFQHNESTTKMEVYEY